ncbi:MAG: iron-containing alcohol dehydrogenase [Bacillota bacterium]|nr:iron-containing alcohol dehydrogenase [Bacillota bacterium]
MTALLDWEFRVPRSIAFGPETHKLAGEKVKEAGGRHALVVSGPNAARSGIVAKVTDSLQAAGVAFTLFPEVDTEPTVAQVDAGLARLKEAGCDAVVAVGGGSPIDAAKAIALLATNGGDITEYMGANKVKRPILPLIAIPTTAGTGSEVTRHTVVTDSAKNVKMLISSPYLVPAAAIDDPTLTYSMPPQVTASTGLDALTHAIEAHVSKKATPLTDILALAAVRRIFTWLRVAWADGGNAEARREMLLGQLEAGMAFSNSSVALVHGMSRPIGAYFHVPHGIANAMLLPVVMEFSLLGAPRRFAALAEAMGLPVEGCAVMEAGRKAVKAVRDLCADLRIPSLTGYGLDPAEVMEAAPRMARDALASGSPANNPRQAAAEEIVELYRRAL